jgi:hypothetical protein
VVVTGCVAFVAFVLVYFAPQDLFIDTSVDEPFPSTSAGPHAAAGRTPSASSPRPGRPTGRPEQRGPSVLARGAFRSGEHDTTGAALLIALSDGSVYVRLENLDTSNGPDVRIWLSAAGYRASDDAVHAAAHLDLGGLKANHGNQNYRLPAGARVTSYRSVVIWCRRFEVVFGSAPLSA